MIKRILIPLDPSEYTKAAIQVGAQIARRTDAELTGLVILDIEGIEDSIGPIPMGGLYYAERMEMAMKVEASQRVKDLLEDFKKRCEKLKVRYNEAHVQGFPSKKIIEEAMYFDLVILGLKTHFNFEVSDKMESIEKILKESITPILAVPPHFRFSEDSKVKTRAVLAFDGSLLAARAMQRFAQLINPDYFDLTLIYSGEDIKYGQTLIQRAEGYMKAHGVMSLETMISSQDIIEMIRDHFWEKTDVFVVGAHGHEGIFDFMVGSLTKYVVNQKDKAVFIGQ